MHLKIIKIVVNDVCAYEVVGLTKGNTCTLLDSSSEIYRPTDVYNIIVLLMDTFVMFNNTKHYGYTLMT